MVSQYQELNHQQLEAPGPSQGTCLQETSGCQVGQSGPLLLSRPRLLGTVLPSLGCLLLVPRITGCLLSGDVFLCTSSHSLCEEQGPKEGLRE